VTLFSFPPQALVGRVLPKNKIYRHGKVGAALRERFVAQVDQIVWQYKLAPETVNLPARGGIEEIEIFDIALKTDDVDEAVLRAVDRAIPLPILFQLRHGARRRLAAAYKRPSLAEAGKWVIDGYFFGAWQAVEAPGQPLPIALDLAGLYEQLLRSLLPAPGRPGENLPDQIERLAALRSRRNDCAKLEARLRKEVQFNRKVALNAELRAIREEIARLGD
jgi:hypothetical protein